MNISAGVAVAAFRSNATYLASADFASQRVKEPHRLESITDAFITKLGNGIGRFRDSAQSSAMLLHGRLKGTFTFFLQFHITLHNFV